MQLQYMRINVSVLTRPLTSRLAFVHLDPIHANMVRSSWIEAGFIIS
jgi:hypothetical protein